MRFSRELRCRSRTVLLAVLAGFLFSARARGQLGATVPNWSVGSNVTHSGGSSGVKALADIGHEIGFEPVTPCRIVDTRGPTGTFGAPSLSPGVSRNFPLPTGPCAGIPIGVGSYSLNVTVTNTLGPGFIKIYPQGGAAPVVSTLNYIAGQTVANAAIVPAGTGGEITVVAGVSGTDLIIDINGYYSQSLNPANFFSVITAYPGGGGVILGENLDTTSVGYGGDFKTQSPVDGSAGVRGIALATSGLASGVLGETNSTAVNASGVQGIVVPMSPGSGSAGVLGVNNGTDGLGIGVVGTQAGNGYGVFGFTPSGVGVFGGTTSGTGVYGDTFASAGSAGAIWGQALATSGQVPGVTGETFSTDPNAIGVLGQVKGSTSGLTSVGVRGINQGTGAFGIGVWGSQNGSGYGVLGSVTGAGYGVVGQVFTTAGAGVLALGNFVATGTKSFVEPHPTDASKEIRYVALEGPESGTYFRGRGTFQNGLAVIDVPESFRLVTDPEGLSVQVTPIGAMATVAVLRIDLDKIVVQASRSVDFFYIVNGVRRTQKNFEPIHEAKIFAPQGPEAQLPEWLTAEQKKMLIANGTYNADGSVNMETARRLGWTRVWEKQAEQVRAQAESALERAPTTARQ